MKLCNNVNAVCEDTKTGSHFYFIKKRSSFACFKLCSFNVHQLLAKLTQGKAKARHDIAQKKQDMIKKKDTETCSQSILER